MSHEGLAREVKKAAESGGVTLNNGRVVGLTATHADVNLGRVTVPAKIPAHLFGVLAIDHFVEVIGSENYWIVLSTITVPSWFDTGFSAASGWSIIQKGYRYSAGPYITVGVRVERTGSTITASSTGHLADTTVLTCPAAVLPSVTWPLNSIPLVWRTSFSIGGGYIDTTTADMVLTDLHPNASISSGDYMSALVTYPA